ncbi:CDPK-related protein kinase, partial [Glycine soja]
WSIGVIAYILLCGSRPFWGRTESGIFRAVLKVDPSFDQTLWPSLSFEAKDFVKRILNKDPLKRLFAAQALCHPWIRNCNNVKVPLDILIFKLMKTYMRSSSLRKAALRVPALRVHQLEALDRWEQHTRCAYELFDKDGNRAIVIEQIASELGLGPSILVHVVLHDWICHTDGKLSFLGLVKFKAKALWIC